MASVTADGSRACSRSRVSSDMVCGNLGAMPKPPRRSSCWARSCPWTASRASLPGTAASSPGSRRADRPSAAVSWSAWDVTSSRWVRHTSSMRRHRSGNEIMPPRGALGK